MDSRKPETKKAAEIEIGLLIPKTPDLSLRRLDRVVSFKLPKAHRRDSIAVDLPTIEPDRLAALKALWSLDDAIETQPGKLLVDAVKQHLSEIHIYIEALKTYQSSWFECWQFLNKIAHELDQALKAEKSERFYSLPESLVIQEKRAFAKLGKDDVEFNEARLKYATEVDKRNAEIQDLTEKIKEITEAASLAALKKLDKPIIHHQPIRTDESKSACCLIRFFSMFARRQTSSEAANLTSDNIPVDAHAMQTLRAKILAEYNGELQLKTDLLNEYCEFSAPKKSAKYRNEFNDVRAKILYHKIDFYRCQTPEVMLLCIRLYALAVRTYFIIYGDNPVADKQPGHVDKVFDDRDKIILKAKDVFRQLIRGMKSHINLYYCLQPDRCEFTQYMNNYETIPSHEERDAILAGKATPEMIEKVFPEFESPDEAFATPKP